MSEYLIAIFAAAAVTSLCGFTLFSGRQDKVAAAALGIVLAASVLSPLISVFRSVAEGLEPDASEYGSAAFGEVMEASLEDADRKSVV